MVRSTGCSRRAGRCGAARYGRTVPQAALIYGLVCDTPGRRDKPLDTLLAGMGNSDVMLMCLIFLLAGAFAAVSKAIGGVDAVIWLTLAAIPSWLALPGLFLVAGFVVLAMGTSMGTIAAARRSRWGWRKPPALALSAVLSGATFGDNLSVISDTAIAASRLQGASMRDKFRANSWLALPAALACLVLLVLLGDGAAAPSVAPASPWAALPYLIVLVLFSIAAVSTLTDVFAANNTVARLISGSTAREIAQRHGVSPAHSASLLDIFACVTQSVLPYGAQILLAASIARASPLELVGQVHYGWLLALVTLASIALGLPRRALRPALPLRPADRESADFPGTRSCP